MLLLTCLSLNIDIPSPSSAFPTGALGLLQEWGARLCALQRTLRPSLGPARLLTFAADHGITAEGQAPWVSPYPRSVTAAMFAAVASGQAACAVLCTANGVSLELVDVGVDADVLAIGAAGASACTNGSVSGNANGTSKCGGSAAAAATGISVVHAKVRRGSHSMLAGPALTAGELQAALDAGAAAVARFAAAAGCPPSSCAVCIGEVGIGNTTAAAAVLAALTGLPPEEVCGRGTGGQQGLAPAQSGYRCGLLLHLVNNTSQPAGLPAAAAPCIQECHCAAIEQLNNQPSSVCPSSPSHFLSGLDDAGVQRKCAAVAAALAANASAIGDGSDPLAALAAVGGLELAAMAGAFLEAGRRGMPAVVDGFISSAAAAVAARADPRAAAVQFWSHASAERGAATAAKAAGSHTQAALSMNMRLGEGTGAVLAVPLLRSAAAIARDMGSLEEVLAAAAPPADGQQANSSN